MKKVEKIKIIIVIILMLLSNALCSCSGVNDGNDPSSPDDENKMAFTEYPITQGSNPTRVISEELFMHFTGLNDLEGDYDRIRHTGTSDAYEEFLAEGSDIDMIIVQQADTKSEKEMEDNYYFKPVAKDALVFITNISNPVDDITMDQAKDILTGKITNWIEVGGKDRLINLFVRNEAGGSQILLEKYVMNGNPVAHVHPGNIANDMKEMSKNVGEMTQHGQTFGYTTYYFAEFAGKRDDVKTIKIEGIKADYESISSGTYPIIANIFIGIRDMDLSAQVIFEWITTSEGQSLIKNTGYVPLH